MIRNSLSSFIGAAMLSVAGNSQGAVLWQQDFNEGGSLSDYVGSAPGQFDSISSSGVGLSWSITDGALQGTRIGNTGAATINTDNFGTPVLLVELRLQISSINASGTTAIMFAVGSSFDTTNTHPGNVDTHSDFSLNSPMVPRTASVSATMTTEPISATPPPAPMRSRPANGSICGGASTTQGRPFPTRVPTARQPCFRTIVGISGRNSAEPGIRSATTLPTSATPETSSMTSKSPLSAAKAPSSWIPSV